jgi:type II secretion system protein N
MKLIRRFFLALALLIALRVYTGGFSEVISVRIQNLIERQGIPCRVESVAIGFIWRVKVGRLTCQIGGEELALAELAVAPSLSGLLRLNPGVTLEGNALPGRFRVELERSILSGIGGVKVEANGIFLENLPKFHPRVEVRGVLEGVFEGELTNHGAGALKVSDLQVKTSSQFLKLPELESGELVAQIELRDGIITAKPLSFKADLGEADGALTFNIAERTYDGAVEVHLSDLGVRQVGGYLAMAAGKEIDRPVEDWKINLSGSLRGVTPRVTVQEMR